MTMRDLARIRHHTAIIRLVTFGTLVLPILLAACGPGDGGGGGGGGTGY
jgi:hypothetical protein